MTNPSSEVIVIGPNDDNHQNLFLKQDKKDVYHEQTVEDPDYSNVVFKTETNLTRGLKQRHIQMFSFWLVSLVQDCFYLLEVH